MRQQCKVISEAKVLQHIKECPPDPSWMVFCCVSHHPNYHQVKKDCRHDTSLMCTSFDLEVLAAASYAADEVVVEALDDLDTAQGNPMGSQNVP